MILYGLLNRGIWFPQKPFHNLNIAKFCLGLHLHGNVSSKNSPQSLNLMSICFPICLINSLKVFAISISISLPYFRPGIFDLTKTSLEIIWFKDHMLTTTTTFFYFSHSGNYLLHELLRQLLGICDIQINAHFHFGPL